MVIGGRALVTGQIPRTTPFEKGSPAQVAWIDGKWQPDPWIHDDQAIVLNVKNKGLVVLTGCGHAGVVNTLKCARELTGVDQIHAVIGGFHLTGPTFESIIAPTIQALQQFSPRVIVPQHCTGWKATHLIAQRISCGIHSQQCRDDDGDRRLEVSSKIKLERDESRIIHRVFVS